VKTTTAQTTTAQTTTAQTTDTQQAGVATTHHAGTSGSHSTDSASTKATASATPVPAASGGQVAAAAVGGTNTDGAHGQKSDRNAHHRIAEARPVAASAIAASTHTGDSAPGKAAPITHSSATHVSATHTVASPDAGLQVSAPAAPAPAHAAALAPPSQPTFPVPLSSQLSGQLTSLRQLPHGEHVLTLTVNPETFGPVKVVAHITHDGVALQLFGASDQAREALKAALPDLRRDLAGTGLQPNLELGSGSGSGAGGRGAMSDPSSFAGNGNAPYQSPRPPFGGTVAAGISTADHTIQATLRGGLDLVL
jgi:flagellar hook-length control protein FliK